jgi:hypothetical protein
MRRHKATRKGEPSHIKTMGATNLSTSKRQKQDYYATEPKAVRLLLEMENFEGRIWECACGEGHLSKEMKRLGRIVYSTDLVDRGYGQSFQDFLEATHTHMNIITNPPYKFANEFILKALQILQPNRKAAFFLPIRYMEGQARKELFTKHPPKIIYVSASRLICAKNGNFKATKGSSVAYAWFVWEHGFKGKTTIKWFN